MALHIIKLAVGAESLDTLKAWTERKAADAQAADGHALVRLSTRMAPKRIDEVLDGGSLYWVIRGVVQARQAIVGFEPYKDAGGVGRVHIVMAPEVVAVRPCPRRPFQGWRYLRPQDAPSDWHVEDASETFPPAMRRELMELCLI